MLEAIKALNDCNQRAGDRKDKLPGLPLALHIGGVDGAKGRSKWFHGFQKKGSWEHLSTKFALSGPTGFKIFFSVRGMMQIWLHGQGWVIKIVFNLYIYICAIYIYIYILFHVPNIGDCSRS